MFDWKFSDAGIVNYGPSWVERGWLAWKNRNSWCCCRLWLWRLLGALLGGSTHLSAVFSTGGSPGAFIPPPSSRPPLEPAFLAGCLLTKLPGVARGFPVMSVTVTWLPGRECRSVAPGRWWLHKHPDGRPSGKMAPAHPREENTPEAACGWGACSPAWRGGFQWNDFSHLWRKREKSSCIRQTQGAQEHKGFSPLLGFEGSGSVYFYSSVFFPLISSDKDSISVEQEQTDRPSGCSGTEGHPRTLQTRPPGRESTDSRWPENAPSRDSPGPGRSQRSPGSQGNSRKVRTRAEVFNPKEREDGSRDLVNRAERVTEDDRGRRRLTRW